MRTVHWSRITTLALAAGLAAACETGTEPREGPTFDAEAALADYQALDTVLASEGMEGFRAMAKGVTFDSFGEEVRFVGRVAEALGWSPEVVGNPAGLPLRIREAAAGAHIPPSPDPIISSFRRGKTFVYDPDLGRYVVAPDRAGAPETGVRFILYEPGPDGKPDPDREIGYADLIDEGDYSAEEVSLRLMVVQGDRVVLDYRTAVDFMERGGSVTVDGFLQGEYDRLDFDIEVTGAAGDGGATMDVLFEMGIVERDFLISGSLHGVHGNTGSGGELDLTVRHGTDSFSVQATLGETWMEGTFYLNGELFATVEGDPEAPTILGADGEALGWAEAFVLHRILDSAEDVFDLFEDLLDPVDELVILALIL